MPTAKTLTSTIRPICIESGRVKLIDQRKLPHKLEYFDATELDDMCFAISDMVVRGAPAIGVAGALGLACEAQRLVKSLKDRAQADFLEALSKAKTQLQATRPTAINLHWGTEKIFNLAQSAGDKSLSQIADSLFIEAQQMIEDDIATNKAIGEHGAGLIQDKNSVLTHCNAGALCSCGWGTALGVVRSAVEHGSSVHVFVDETRPRQQGARLTAWELMTDGIDATLVADTAAGYLMSQGKVDLVIVGADRIAANGDTANKIGTYTLAVLANAHGIPFYVAAPRSTIDANIDEGKHIPIEERDASEVTSINGKDISPPDMKVLNPAFDVTPNRLITAIITEVGILRAPYLETIQRALIQK